MLLEYQGHSHCIAFTYLNGLAGFDRHSMRIKSISATMSHGFVVNYALSMADDR